MTGIEIGLAICGLSGITGGFIAFVASRSEKSALKQSNTLPSVAFLVLAAAILGLVELGPEAGAHHRSGSVAQQTLNHG